VNSLCFLNLSRFAITVTLPGASCYAEQGGQVDGWVKDHVDQVRRAQVLMRD